MVDPRSKKMRPVHERRCTELNVASPAVVQKHYCAVVKKDSNLMNAAPWAVVYASGLKESTLS